jgi:hypothetical protein
VAVSDSEPHRRTFTHPPAHAIAPDGAQDRQLPLRSPPGHSRLVRQLAPWVQPAAEPSGPDFAERMSLWLGAFDAIRLQSAHQAVRSIPAGAPARRPVRGPDLGEDVRRVRSVLAKAVAQPLDAPEPGYAPWQQRHLELQRQMEMMIGPLREHARLALGRHSPRLRRLAVLDAAMEQMLAPREQALLPKLAALLKRRHAQLAAEGAPTERFASEWRDTLLAELDLRLEPVAGLAEALRNASPDQA